MFFRWGNSDYGQFGDGVYRDKERFGVTPPSGVPKFPDNTVIYAIAAGNNHCVALTDNGMIYTYV